MGETCWIASLANQQLFPIQILSIFKLLPILYFSATDLKLGSSTYCFLLFLFLVFTKCQVLNLREGQARSCDQVLQRAYYAGHTCTWKPLYLISSLSLSTIKKYPSSS